MKKIILASLLLVAAVWSAQAQNRTVTGTVSSVEGGTLPGVNVVVEGSTSGTVTDIDGNYSISVDENTTLNFSFIGFTSQSVPVGTRSVLDIVMELDAQELEEVVVTALGIEKEAKTLTYARQAVETEDMKEARTSNFLQNLSGKVAGVQVSNSLTATGSNRVTIRGNASLLGDNTPLYIIDGVVMDKSVGDQQTGSWGGRDSYQPIDNGDAMANINPDDIESMEILKGGNATALYGSRASNGVILITTKKGKTRDGWGVSVNSNTMFTNVNQWPDYQYVYGSGENGGAVRGGANALDPETGLISTADMSPAYGSPLLGQFNVVNMNGEVTPYAPVFGNVKEMFQTGTTFTNSIAIDKAHDNGTFRLGYTNTTAEWMMADRDKLNRHNLTLRATQNLTDKVSVDATMMYIYDEVTNRIVENGSTQNPAQNYISLHPNFGKSTLLPYKDENGYENGSNAGLGTLRNPYWNINENTTSDLTNRVVSNAALSYKIIEGLTFRGRMSVDFRNRSGEKYDAPRGPQAPGDKDGRYSNYDANFTTFNMDAMMSYTKRINDWSVDVSAGTKRWEYMNSTRSAVNDQLIEIPGPKSISNNGNITTANETDYHQRLNSVFTTGTVGFRDMVYINGTWTREWSSTLSPKNNNYSYPSVGATFIFTELMGGGNNLLSFGKLRASYAITGAAAGAYNVYEAYNYIGNYNGSYPYLRTQANKANEFLKNEETSSMEFGLEMKLFNGRIDANVTYYDTESYDQIVPGNVSFTSGYSTAVMNAGLLTNKGWEVFVGANVLKMGDFSWDVDLNWSKNVNFVEDLDGVDPVTGAEFSFENFDLNRWANAFVRVIPGEKYGQIVGNDISRDEAGRPLIDDTGMPVFTDGQVIGDIQPDWMGSVRNSFKWKGIYLNFLIDIKAGGDLLSMTHGRSGQFGINATTLEGREEWLLSSRILGENNQERAGIGQQGTDYDRGDRKQGAYFDGVKYRNYDPTGTGQPVVGTTTGEANDIYVAPGAYGGNMWQHHWRSLFDASYVKLREVAVGYNLPNSLLSKTPFKTARVSVAGRNLWIIHQNTPRGIDPEANSTSGNGQGLEYGAFLPSRSVGFNINFTF